MNNNENNENELRTCSRCHSTILVDFFSYNRKGTLYKICDGCRKKRNCEHNRIKNTCKDCGGGSICEHNRIKSRCKECGGGSICEHNRIKSQCKDCGGSSICEHNNRKSRCKECGGSSICEHNRQKQQCKDCGGSSICEHNSEKSRCKDCGNPIEITIKNMIHSSRTKDKKKNIYDPDNFITSSFLKDLIDECEGEYKCYYCDCEMQFMKMKKDMITIERLDNNKGHIKSNCVFACFSCNSKKVGQKKSQ